MNIVTWLIAGGLTGWAASHYRRDRRGDQRIAAARDRASRPAQRRQLSIRNPIRE
jgi:hypothetical protein